MNKYTHRCGEVSQASVNDKVIIQGWLVRKEKQGGGKIMFLDLQDHTGIIQVTLEKEGLIARLNEILTGSVLEILGILKKREEYKKYWKKTPQGEYEIQCNDVKILNKRLQIADKEGKFTDKIPEKHRVLQLRKPEVQNVIRTRHQLAKAARDFMDMKFFLEIETPILAKSTPEGARDFLVPSRRERGMFFALPQSPQLFKQMSMIGGLDRYFQIARCFRDEDSRSDRLLEFTQLDIEMAFTDQNDLIKIVEGLLLAMFEKVEIDYKIDMDVGFNKFSYSYIAEKYNSDKPILDKHDDPEQKGAPFWVIDFPLFEWKKGDKSWGPSHHPFTSPDSETINALLDGSLNCDALNDENNDLIKKAKSLAYDLVWKGQEIGGGSVRIHDPQLQKKVFEFLGMDENEYKEKFGFFLECLGLGAPPHAGLAIGFDRLVKEITNQKKIRHCVAFPINNSGHSDLLDTPSKVSVEQLAELHIQTIPLDRPPSKQGIFLFDDVDGDKLGHIVRKEFEQWGLDPKSVHIYNWNGKNGENIKENVKMAKEEFLKIKDEIGIVLLDYHLGTDTGETSADADYSLPGFFRYNATVKNFKILAMTGQADPSVVSEMMRKHRFDYYLPKSLGDDSLKRDLKQQQLNKLAIYLFGRSRAMRIIEKPSIILPHRITGGDPLDVLSDDPFKAKDKLKAYANKWLNNNYDEDFGIIDLSRGDPGDDPSELPDKTFAHILSCYCSNTKIKPEKEVENLIKFVGKKIGRSFPNDTDDRDGMRGRGYSQNVMGDDAARKIVAAYLNEIIGRHNCDGNPNVAFKNIGLFAGASEAVSVLFKLFQDAELIGTNKTIFCGISPVYGPYNAQFGLGLTGIPRIMIETIPDEDYKITKENVQKWVDKTIKAGGEEDKNVIFVLVSPNNPTGRIYTKDELDYLKSGLEQFKNCIVIEDLVYAEFADKIDFLPLYNIMSKNTIVVSSLSKAYRATGMRFGYIYLPPDFQDYLKQSLDIDDILSRIELIKSPDKMGAFSHTHHLSRPVQYFGLLKLAESLMTNTNGMPEAMKEFMNNIRKRWDSFHEDLGISKKNGFAPYYILIDLKELRDKSKNVAIKNKKVDDIFMGLAEEKGVILLPAANFYIGKEEDNKWMARVSVANADLNTIKCAAVRIENYFG